MVSNLTVSVGATSTNVLPAQAFSKKRQQVVISNASAYDVYLSFGAPAVSEYGVLLKSGAGFSINASDDAGLISESINAISNGSGRVLSVTIVE